MREPYADRLDLARGEGQLCPLLDPRDRLIGIDRWPWRFSDAERLQLRSDLALGSVQCREKNAAPALDIVGDDGPVLEFEIKGGLDQFRRDLKQFAR